MSGCVAKIWLQAALACSNCSNESKASKDNASGDPVIDSRAIQELGTSTRSQARLMAICNLARSLSFPNWDSWCTSTNSAGGCVTVLVASSVCAEAAGTRQDNSKR